MLTKSRLTIATALAAAAVAAPPALALPVDADSAAATTDVRGEHAASLSESRTAPDQRTAADLGTADARGEHAAAMSESPTASDQRSPDAREPFVRQPVVVEIDDPVAGGFDWTAGIIGLAAGLAVAVLAGAAVAGARRRPIRPSVG
jgi:hypothetical protein